MKEFIKALAEFLVIIISTLIVIVGVAYIGVSIEKVSDNEIYNDGQCNYCERGHYELINVGKDIGDDLYYLYKCDNCNMIIELHSNMELKAL